MSLGWAIAVIAINVLCSVLNVVYLICLSKK